MNTINNINHYISARKVQLCTVPNFQMPDYLLMQCESLQMDEWTFLWNHQNCAAWINEPLHVNVLVDTTFNFLSKKSYAVCVVNKNC